LDINSLSEFYRTVISLQAFYESMSLMKCESKPRSARPAPGDITLLLTDVKNGSESAANKLISTVYDDFCQIAARQFRHERRDHTLQPTDLVHEAYLRLLKALRGGFKNRAHLFGTAKQAMRQILIEDARSHKAKKRFHQKVPLEDVGPRPSKIRADDLDVHEAVERIGRVNPLWQRIVHLRTLEGLSPKEAAKVLGIGASTERREWAAARQWLRHQLTEYSPLGSKTLSHYQLLEKIGDGGLTQVYRAREIRTSCIVALKVLPAGFLVDPDFRRRFVQEARCASALSHPNIVNVYKIEQGWDMDFIVMEYVPGSRLDVVIPTGGLPLHTWLNYALQITTALATAHSAGVIHRDLKPSNILVTENGLLKLLDFGLAKLVTSPEKLGRSWPSPRTRHGTILGTVGYMAPEQVLGQAVDGRADIFALGAVFYEMLSGRRAFKEKSAIETMNAILNLHPAGLRSTLPTVITQVVWRCLHKEPAQRYQTTDGVIADLEVAASYMSKRRRR
jgi:RNA polymerase sigma factor (TIGR02999 family)